MTDHDRMPIRRALISVFDKTGVADLARDLSNRGVTILSTGGTARLLRDEGIDVTDVSDVTGFPEMMDGRVKTLHPRIHGGLLMRRDVDIDVASAAEQGIEPIDLLVVNLYPFREVIAKPDVTEAEAIEMIDIGGPAMLRAAAKNHAFTAVVTDPTDYASLRESLATQAGATVLSQRRTFARKAFAHTAEYDAAVQAWLDEDSFLPEKLVVGYEKIQDLRYGENPHQRAAAYRAKHPGEASIAWSKMHSGKELSFNNYLDAAAALDCVRHLGYPGAVVIKHKNPCGAAVHPKDLLEAFTKAYEGDPLSAYGGIIAFNRSLTEDVARTIATKDKFFEVIVAPGYEGESLGILQTGAKWGAKVRILEVDELEKVTPLDDDDERELRWIRGGMLVQQRDASVDVEFVTATQRAPTKEEAADLRLAWELCRHVTSNAIVFCRDQQLVGTGAGQMSRVDSVHLASRKAGGRSKGAVMASDAFFPFADGIEAAHEAGITAVIQPGGSIRDKDVVAACDAMNIAMLMTGRRHFRH